MGWDQLTTALAVLLGVLLVWAGIEDVRRREIANWKNAAIALLAPIWWWSNGLTPWPDMATQLLLGLIVFAVFCAMFIAGWMGGGDVKMIAALALWLPAGTLLQMLAAMSLLGGAVTLLLLVERAWRRRPAAIEVPYGVAIAAAGLLSLREPVLNHFG